MRRGTVALAVVPRSTFVYSAGGRLLGKGTATSGRVYAPGVVADLDRDGTKEIVVTTFDHGIDVYRVPRSGTERLPWPTGRGGLLRGGT